MSFKEPSFLYNKSSRQKITKDVADPDQRHYLVEAQIRQGIPLQLRAMREGQGWTQETLAQKLGTTQNAISRLENPRTGKPTITTLERIAQVFDVALVVKFAPFSEFVDSLSGLSETSVSVPSYEEEAREPNTEEMGSSGDISTSIQILSAYSEDTYIDSWPPLLYRTIYPKTSVDLEDRNLYVEPKRA